MKKSDDQSLILKKVSQGDSLSFRLLMEKYSEQLYNFAFYFLKSRETSEEVVSDVFYKFWSNRQNLPQIKNIESYLYTSVKNQSLNYIEKNQKMRYLDVKADTLPELVSEELNPEKAVLAEELKAQIDQAIERLPEKCRLIFKMVREDGMKYKQVAEIMDISVNTVKEQMARALKSIRLEVEGYRQIESCQPKKKGKVVKIASYASMMIYFSFFFKGL